MPDTRYGFPGPSFISGNPPIYPGEESDESLYRHSLHTYLMTFCLSLFMSSEERSERRSRHSGHYLIPAGILIGLGLGLLIGHIASMLLIGLGCGFILAAVAGRKSAAYSSDSQPSESGSVEGNTCCNMKNWSPCSCNGFRGGFLFIGIFFIILGVAITWAPPSFWKYIAAAVLILFGIWFVYREYTRNR